MGFSPPAIARRIPRLFQRPTRPSNLVKGDLWSDLTNNIPTYYDGSNVLPLSLMTTGGGFYQVQGYKTAAGTWGDAWRAAYAAAVAANGGYLLGPAGISYSLDQIGHGSVIQHARDNAGTVGRIVLDFNWATVSLGATTRRLADPLKVADYDWFRNLEICNAWLDCSAIPATASNEHVIFGNNTAGGLSKLNFENIEIHHLKGYGLTLRGTGGTPGRKWWIALAPTCDVNDATPIAMRGIGIHDLNLLGGDCPFFVAGQIRTGTLAQPSDFVNCTIDDCHVARVAWDSGVIPPSFNSGGAQVGSYALTRNCSIRDTSLKGAGDAGLEIDNCHGFVLDNVTIENSWNANFLVSSFGADPTDSGQRNQHAIIRNCTSIVSDPSLTNCIGYYVYTIRHHRLGTVELVGSHHETVALRLAGDGDAAVFGNCVSTTVGAVPLTPFTTLVTAANGTLNVVVGEDIHVGAGSGATGEWANVLAIVDDHTLTLAAPLVNTYAIGAAIVQPTPSERLVFRDFTTRDQGWTFPASVGIVTQHTPIEINASNAVVVMHNVSVDSKGSTAAAAQQFNVYGVALNGRNLTLFIDGLDVKAALTYAGAQGSFRALSLGHRSAYQPLTARGRVKGLRPVAVSGFPIANQTGIYLPDRTGLVIDPQELLVAECDFSGLALGAKEVTWQTAQENTLAAVLADSNRPRSHVTWPHTLTWVEEWLGGSSTSSTAIGEGGWATNDITGGGATSKLFAAGHPGQQQLDSGATTGNVRWLAQSTVAGIDSAEAFDLYIWFELDAGTFTAASELLRLGVSSAWNNNPPASGIWMEKAAAGTNWLTVTSNASAQTSVDSGVAVASGFHQLRIRQHKIAGVRTAGFTLDQGAEILQTGINLPATTIGAYVGFQVGNGSASASRKLNIHRVRLRVPNLVE